ncbi:hypothetical protein AB4Z33_14655 [Paenibacillus sp. 2TAB19]
MRQPALPSYGKILQREETAASLSMYAVSSMYVSHSLAFSAYD